MYWPHLPGNREWRPQTPVPFSTASGTPSHYPGRSSGLTPGLHHSALVQSKSNGHSVNVRGFHLLGPVVQ